MKDKMVKIVKQLNKEFPDSEKTLHIETGIKYGPDENCGVISVRKEGRDLFYAVLTPDSDEKAFDETLKKLRTIYK